MSDSATSADGGLAGHVLITSAWLSTFVFGLTATGATAGIEAAEYTAVVVSLVLFAASLPMALAALAAGAVRTARHNERVTVTGLFFLHRSAPTRIRWHLLGTQALTLLIVVATASAQPFGVLVPVFPLAVSGLWGARHGTFPQIPEPSH